MRSFQKILLLLIGLFNFSLLYSQGGTGLPIWPLSVGGGGNAQVIDWTNPNPFPNPIPNTISEIGGTGAAFNNCGDLLFYVLHTGVTNTSNNIYIYSANGEPLLTASTANAPGLNGSRSDNEIQVVKVPETPNQWYIIYNMWKTDDDAPYSTDGGYTPSEILYSRVEYNGSTLSVLERDIALDINNTFYTYTFGKAVSRTINGNENQHYLYTCRRAGENDSLSLDRFIISNSGIAWESNTGDIAADWWFLTVVDSPIELSPTEEKIAVVNRNQTLNWGDIFIFDANNFSNTSVQEVSLGELILQPDFNILPVPEAINSIAFNNDNLHFLRNFEKKVSYIEFSPNGQYLYIGNGGYTSTGFTNLSYLGQIDLSTVYPYEIRLQVQSVPSDLNMETGKGCVYSLCGENWRSIHDIQLSFNGNLYFTKKNCDTLFVIPEPNQPMPQMLVPGNIDLATSNKPNIAINGDVLRLPDQIDGHNYLIDSPINLDFTSENIYTENVCNGSATVIPSNGAPPYTFHWPHNGGAGDTQTGLCEGTYTVVVTDALGCTATDTVTIILQTGIISTSIISDISCFQETNGSIDLSVSNGTPPYSYIWNTGAIDEDIQNLPGGTYTVTISDFNDSNAVYTVTIPEPTELSSSISSTGIQCFGNTNAAIDLSIAGGTPVYSYLWNTGAITEDLSSLSPGLYTVTITDEHNCSVIDSVTIADITQPLNTTLTHTDLLCYGDSTSSIEAFVTGGTPPYFFIWSNSETQQNISNISAGNYTVTIFDNNNCTYSKSIEINQPDELTIELPSDFEICSDSIETVTSNIYGGTSPYLYQWNNGESTPNIIISPSQETTYEVTVTDNNNCSVSQQLVVSIYPEITIDAISDKAQVCEGDHVIIDATFPTGNPSLVFVDNELSSLPLSVSLSESHTYTIEVIDNCGISAIDQVSISSFESIPVNFSSDIINGCQPLEVHFNEESPDNGQTYLWNFNEDSNYDSFSKNPTFVFNEDGLYDISLIVTSADGCSKSITNANMITVYPRPKALFTSEPHFINILDPTVKLNNNSTLLYHCDWFFGDGSSSTAVNPSHTYDYIGKYTVELIATTNRGCKDSIINIITIHPEYTFYAPTAFSPDKDNVNDIFFVFGEGIDNKNFKLEIFDRWGEIIFESNDINIGWDGKVKGKNIAINGVYTWLATFKNTNQTSRQESGKVTVIR